MTILKLLSHLFDLDIKLWVDDKKQLRFNAPQGAMTPEMREEIVAHKEEIIAFLQSVKSTAYQELPPIVPVPRNGRIPLSFAQQRLWFLRQLDPDNREYNLGEAIRLIGSLNVSLLEQCLNEVVRRHEALRTTLSVIDGKAFQTILPDLKIPLPLLHLDDLSKEVQEQEISQLFEQEISRSFDLMSGPLIRALLLKLGNEEHILFVSVDHIVSDGWSMMILVQEMTTLYEALSTSSSMPLPLLPIQYADFSAWQWELLQGDVLKKLVNYWEQHLDITNPVVELPTDHPRSSRQSVRGAFLSFTLSAATTNALKAFSKQKGVNLFSTLLAAYNVLLHHYTGQDDICVGTYTANRDRHQIEGLIGVFFNILALRTQLHKDLTFDELLDHVYKVVLGAYAHQDIPYNKLLEELHPERSRGGMLLFRTMLVLHVAPILTVKLPQLTAARIDLSKEFVSPPDADEAYISPPNSDLDLLFEETDQGLLGIAHYDPDLFDADTVARIVTHFQIIVDNVIANPQQRLSILPLLLTAKQHQQLYGWQVVSSRYTKDECIHHLFEVQAAKTPNAIAITYEGKQLTYRELNCRANRLAHHLQKLGIGPEVLVGLCVERSIEMIIGILGILKAGGAYVPLDPEYPKDRLLFILEDAQVLVLLTQERLISNLPDHQAQVVCLDVNDEVDNLELEQNPISKAQPDNAAYVIYTSGSTGKPKGVPVTHYNVTRLFAGTNDWYHFNENDVWTLFHSFAFDFSVWEIWGALLYGGRLVIVPYWVSREPESFYGLLRTEKVTVLNQTPSVFRQLIQVEEMNGTAPDLALRLVVFGGEALTLQTLRPWFERHGDQHPQLVNMYGITETTVHVTYRPLTMADVVEGKGSIIGKPIPDLQVYVLDKYGQPVPIGVSGEMYVGGAGLGRGYLNRPGLTADRFIPDPFNPNERNALAINGYRLYKTGDLARYLPNSDLEYLGRIDHQVKIRGFRIELGEIETVLIEHAAIQEAVILAQEYESEEKQLVAYLVSKTSPPPSVADLRDSLKQKLPSYMIPAAFIVLQALPLTPHGKIDRQALLSINNIQPERSHKFVAPETPLEKRIANIWGQALGRDDIGLYDDFFELGGHSLMAVQIINQINETFGIKVPITRLFSEDPTVANLALLVEEMLVSMLEERARRKTNNEPAPEG